MRVTLLLTSLWALVGATTMQIAEQDSLSTVPEGWEWIAAAPADKRLFFRVGMKQADAELYRQTLHDIANPSSPQYGKHLSRMELKRLVKPTEYATHTVLKWLYASGVENHDIENDGGDFVNFVTTVAKANAMMDTNFGIYRSSAGHEKVRTLNYSLPSNVMQYVEMVQPTTRFGQIRPQFSWIKDKQVIGKVDSNTVSTASTSVDANCSQAITPACLQELYNIKGFTPNRSSAGFIGINGFLNQFARYSDLQKFANQYAPFVKNASFDWTSISGGQLNQTYEGDATEANLDIQ